MIGHWLFHWVWQDFGVPVWPNIAADVMAACWTLSRVKKHLHRHHEEIKKTVNGGVHDV